MVEVGQLGAAILLLPVGGVVALVFVTALGGGDVVAIMNLLSRLLVPVVALTMLLAGVLAFINASTGQSR